MPQSFDLSFLHVKHLLVQRGHKLEQNNYS